MRRHVSHLKHARTLPLRAARIRSDTAHDLEQKLRHCERSAAVHAVRSHGLLHCVRNDESVHGKRSAAIHVPLDCRVATRLAMTAFLLVKQSGQKPRPSRTY